MFFKKIINPSDFNHISGVLELWNSTKVLKKRLPKGCAESEINDLETKLNVSLPEAYKEFLKWAGDDTRGVFVGSEAFIDDVIYNNDALDSILKEDNLKHFENKQHICFFSHQGYVFYWFYDTRNPDPICFKYAETEDGIFFEEVGMYSQVLYNMIAELIPTLEFLEKN